MPRSPVRLAFSSWQQILSGCKRTCRVQSAACAEKHPAGQSLRKSATQPCGAGIQLLAAFQANHFGRKFQKVGNAFNSNDTNWYSEFKLLLKSQEGKHTQHCRSSSSLTLTGMQGLSQDREAKSHRFFPRCGSHQSSRGTSWDLVALHGRSCPLVPPSRHDQCGMVAMERCHRIPLGFRPHPPRNHKFEGSIPGRSSSRKS